MVNRADHSSAPRASGAGRGPPQGRPKGEPGERASVVRSLPMATSVEDLESYLDRLGRRYERVDDATLLVAFGPGQPPVALRVAPPVALAQAEIGPCPPETEAGALKAARLYRRLLELNAGGLVHAAYGVEKSPDGDRIILASALELSNLDLNELEAVLADLDIALAEHVPELRMLVGDGSN